MEHITRGECNPMVRKQQFGTNHNTLLRRSHSITIANASGWFGPLKGTLGISVLGNADLTRLGIGNRRHNVRNIALSNKFDTDCPEHRSTGHGVVSVSHLKPRFNDRFEH